MEVKSQGIVLRCSKYSDNNYIAQILTREAGKISFAVYAPQSKRARIRSSMLQPLTLLELDFDSKPSRNIQQIKDAKLLSMGVLSPAKMSVAIFVSDVVGCTTVEGNADLLLYNKVLDIVNHLNSDAPVDGHFAIRFLLDYADALGFNPVRDFENVVLRDFVGTLVEQRERELFIRLVDAASGGNVNIFNHDERKSLLRILLLYYQMNLPDMPAVKSLDVLEEMYS